VRRARSQSQPRGGRLHVEVATTTTSTSRRIAIQAAHSPLQAQTRRAQGRPRPQVLLLPVIRHDQRAATITAPLYQRDLARHEDTSIDVEIKRY